MRSEYIRDVLGFWVENNTVTDAKFNQNLRLDDYYELLFEFVDIKDGMYHNFITLSTDRRIKTLEDFTDFILGNLKIYTDGIDMCLDKVLVRIHSIKKLKDKNIRYSWYGKPYKKRDLYEYYKGQK
jgi:hypothetical protein